MRSILKVVLIIGLVIGFWSNKGFAQFTYSETPLIKVLEELRKETGYVILYRESLIKGINISLENSDIEIFQLLKQRLRSRDLDLLVDHTLRQVVLFRRKDIESNKNIQFVGYVVDSESGERLPFATLSWRSNDELTGVAANESGYFSLRASIGKGFFSLKASYLGYESQELELNINDMRNLEEVTFRLSPKITNTREVIVTSFRQFSDNSSIQKALDITRGNILGESNIIKSLQHLPSVSVGPALSEGLNVRGSPSDGFQVLLDGVRIYNQTHMFGLFDNFNSDALQTSGLYYGITPASYQAPIGGTLALITRTGSVNDFKADLGLSNISFNATLEGPISKGRSSFMLSGRTSLINQVDWFGNSELVRWGLDVDRPTKFLGSDNINLRSDLVRPTNSSADFGDIHAKVNLESRSGARFMLSGYYGFDDITVNSDRLFRSFRPGTGSQLEYLPVSSENRWNNGKLSGHFHNRIGENIFNRSTAGWSVFNTHFNKDDFTYTQINPGTGTLESFTSDITIKSILNEVILREDLEWVNGKTIISGGLSYQYFQGEYFEDSFERPSYLKVDKAQKIDAYIHSDFNPIDLLSIKGGMRVHYYSQGNYLNFSPRLNTLFFPEAVIRLGAGYSRNFQYVNQVSFSNVLSSDVWILVDKDQPPSFVDYFTAGIYLYQPHLQAQVEGYLKKYENLRLHEIDTYSVTNAFSSSPWFSDNSGIGKGIEAMLINMYEKFEVNQTLSVSRMELQNPGINGGKAFRADWDRTWQYSGSITLNLMKFLSTTFTQTFATGVPNKLNIFGDQQKKELPYYYRTDIGVSFSKQINSLLVDASINLYNVLDIDNPWYRELGFGVDESSGTAQFVSVPIEVYDLGFQPSFSVSVKF